MLIELEAPFKERWNKGYLQLHPNGRRYVCLYNNRKDRSIISYARYLMSVSLGRFLKAEEHVDHKDDDYSNDSIDNLQILSQAENNAKKRENELRFSGMKAYWVILTCPVCNGDFVKRTRVFIRAQKEGKILTCSRACSAANIGFGSTIRPKSITANKIKVTDLQDGLIRSLRAEGKSDYVISELTGLSRPKIQRYRKEAGID